MPKVESAYEIRLYENLMKEMNAKCGFIALIESASGIHNAAEIASATPRMAGLSLGLADLSAELACQPTWGAMFTFRSLLVAAGGHKGIPVFDGPYLNLKDPEGLEKECNRVREMGLQGKLCIHPGQIEITNRLFSPGTKEVEQARKIVLAADQQGEGAIVVDGKMVDLPVIAAARRTLQVFERINQRKS